MSVNQSFRPQRNRDAYLPAPPKSLITISENASPSAGDLGKALRAIGHALETLDVETFELICEGNNYIVRAKSQSLKKLAIRGFLSEKARHILYTLFPSRYPWPGLEVTYTAEDIERLEREGQSRRRNAATDPNRLTQALRAIGFYIDLKRARLLQISRNGELMTVRYETGSEGAQTEEFDLSSLYTLFVQMYVNRRDGRKSDQASLNGSSDNPDLNEPRRVSSK